MNIGSRLEELAALAWLAALVALGFVVFNAARRRRFCIGIPVIIGAVVAALLLTTAASGLVFINPTERGVVISALAPGGYRPDALEPGLHWITPFAERVEVYDISPRTYTMASNAQGNDSVQARTKDGQVVFIDSSVIYAVDPQKVVNLNIRWQTRYEDGVVRPTTRRSIRDAASQYGMEEVVSSKRTELEKAISDQVAASLAANDLVLVQFVLRDIHR